SFHCTPGLPILHSRDLVNWTIINHAVKNLPHPRYAQVQHGCGIWAPSIRFHAGKFWIFFAMPDEGIYVTTADDPAGKWSEPHLVEPGRGLIDPCPLWDDDGKAYLVHAYARSRAGIKDILRVRPMAPDGSRLLGEGKIVFHAPDKHPTIEGPKFYKLNGWYYILAPAGGVKTGWQVALRARNVYGPYEDRIVMHQGNTPINGPHQGGLVELRNGQWWFVHFQDAGVYGRIVHLQPVAWRDDWPLIGIDLNNDGIGEPVPQYNKPAVPQPTRIAVPQTSDEFESGALSPQWHWHANHKPEWFSLNARPGWLRLYAQPRAHGNLVHAPNLLLQKFPARAFRAETLVNPGQSKLGLETGLVVAGRTSAAVSLQITPEGAALVFRHNEATHVVKKISSAAARLRVDVTEGGVCKFSFASLTGEFESVGQPFQAEPGVWVGAKLGIYAISLGDETDGYADFDYFRFSPTGPK
ncbi:MAG: glycoside hydrolase 43 family protein, partial [Verrucomicrobiae bacterium]|nr:glycoside hydrolase 43 family protein [Verrucomicrobiae bacterium]